MAVGAVDRWGGTSQRQGADTQRYRLLRIAARLTYHRGGQLCGHIDADSCRLLRAACPTDTTGRADEHKVLGSMGRASGSPCDDPDAETHFFHFDSLPPIEGGICRLPRIAARLTPHHQTMNQLRAQMREDVGSCESLPAKLTQARPSTRPSRAWTAQPEGR